MCFCHRHCSCIVADRSSLFFSLLRAHFFQTIAIGANSEIVETLRVSELSGFILEKRVCYIYCDVSDVTTFD